MAVPQNNLQKQCRRILELGPPVWRWWRYCVSLRHCCDSLLSASTWCSPPDRPSLQTPRGRAVPCGTWPGWSPPAPPVYHKTTIISNDTRNRNGAKTGTRKPVPVSGMSDMQFSTKFFWCQFLGTNRTCSIFMQVYGSSFLVGVFGADSWYVYITMDGNCCRRRLGCHICLFIRRWNKIMTERTYF